MKYAIVTFGCRVNQADSAELEGALRARGGEAAHPHEADIVVVNTCSVTASADQAARQSIRRISRHNPGVRIVTTGCYATRAPNDLATLPGVYRTVSNHDKAQLVSCCVTASDTPTDGAEVAGDGPCGAPVEISLLGRTALTVCVQTGCDDRCAYCIIPRTRGSGRSLPPTVATTRVADAMRAGFKEIVLSGVHLGSYGRDLRPTTSLVELLRALDQQPGACMFRISSLEPMDCTPDIIDLVACSGRFAPHFHLPLQHASDDQLRAMRRPYTADDYRRTVYAIRERMPHASIGSDVMAGFPGETENDHRCNVTYLTGSPLTYLHVFPYSERPGTEASRMSGKVPGGIVRRRAAELRAVGSTLARRFRASLVGTVRPALTIEDGTRVVTDNYLKIRIPSGCPRNEWVAVRLDEADEPMTGRLIVRGAAQRGSRSPCASPDAAPVTVGARPR